MNEEKTVKHLDDLENLIVRLLLKIQGRTRGMGNSPIFTREDFKEIAKSFQRLKDGVEEDPPGFKIS